MLWMGGLLLGLCSSDLLWRPLRGWFVLRGGMVLECSACHFERKWLLVLMYSRLWRLSKSSAMLLQAT